MTDYFESELSEQMERGDPGVQQLVWIRFGGTKFTTYCMIEGMGVYSGIVCVACGVSLLLFRV